MGLKRHFATRNQANPVMIKEIADAIKACWDSWNVDGTAAIQYYQPMLDNATYDIVKEEIEGDGI